ncbi:YhcN/YlaJ family sporulation lipoprotein [Paenibacillus hamazuiensis]|uniref:YhcN/YlaJ family sporulation lipoprotein n=1 Tax=Paenibacillus hamazuiensis TaxID=2936508 RepID=UPI0020103C30|nr:YhcN/YlaJ family sporulation lipoprotein [Paenibacillus hamazuiensis]
MRFTQSGLRLATAGLCLAMLAALSGCFPTKDGLSADNYGSKKDDTVQNSSRAYQTQQQYSPVIHNYSKLEMSQFLSDQVQALNGVNSSIVMLADNIAFVALMIDDTASGTYGYTPKNPASGKQGGYSGETNNAGIVRGLYNANDPLRDSYDPNQINPGANSYETVQHHEFLTHNFKQKIAEKIRSAQPTVHDVYISANRDFLNQMTRYAQEAWKGNSLQGYLPEFNATVTKIFGTAPTIPENEH